MTIRSHHSQVCAIFRNSDDHFNQPLIYNSNHWNNFCKTICKNQKEALLKALKLLLTLPLTLLLATVANAFDVNQISVEKTNPIAERLLNRFVADMNSDLAGNEGVTLESFEVVDSNPLIRGASNLSGLYPQTLNYVLNVGRMKIQGTMAIIHRDSTKPNYRSSDHQYSEVQNNNTFVSLNRGRFGGRFGTGQEKDPLYPQQIYDLMETLGEEATAVQ